MEIFAPHHIAAFTARLILGMLFFIQGYDAIFGVGTRTIVQTYRDGVNDKSIPVIWIRIAVAFTSYTELIAGLLLIPGLFIYPSLYLLCANMAVAALGFGLNRPMWDMKHFFPRIALLLYLLSIPAAWHRFSIDHLTSIIF
jgi:uncharacterized membrane protein YphA (DoxX/SURF4 family)